MDNSTDRSRSDTSAVNSILYELLVYSEWKQEPELPKRRTLSQEGFGWQIRKAFFLQPKKGISELIERFLYCLQPWRLCVGDGGKVVAIIQDCCLEIRSSRDEYSSVIAKASLPKDPFHQWRKWCWSPDCSMLAVGFSNGSIGVYDLMGSNLFSIIPAELPQEQSFANTNQSFASCFFLQARSASHKWSSELITVDYNGQLRSYLVSPTEGFQENHSFSFSSHYRFGVTAVAYHPTHSLLFVAGPTGSQSSLHPQVLGDTVGLTAWRILNDHPFYQIIHNDNKSESTSLSNSFWHIPFLGNKHQQSVVLRMEVSPSASRIAALHSCGGVSVWSLPGIRLLGFWSLIDQPNWDVQNPQFDGAGSLNSKRIVASHTNEYFCPVDLDWWSDEAIVLARNSGAVSVCEISNLQNLLGESPEFLSGCAQVKRFHSEKGFIALECDVDVFSKSRKSEKTSEDDSVSECSDDDDGEEKDETPIGLVHPVFNILNSVAYLVTDMERFRPRRKKLRFHQRTYRLLALRSTTPEELYSRKLDNEEYGDALTLAHTYNLDCDHVYQRQWRNNKVSVATIRDYLSKVSNQTWVLRECLDRVPESLLAARELVEFGLKATSKDTFRSLGTKRKIKDVEELTEKQKEFLLFRHTLLRYQDRLTIYEKILGGLQLADELFEHSVYADFRSSSSLRACVLFARASNCQAVECMLTYQGGQTLDHWLPILSNFPETVCPSEYKSLLPEISTEGIVFSWQESQLRIPDWSEKELYMNVGGFELDTPDMDNKWLYEHDPGLSAYRIPIKELTPELLQQWYLERIRAIERSSRMVDNALVLLRLAQDNNVKGLESLYQELQILDALVYEIFLEDVTLADLEKKSPLEKCKLLMSKTAETTFMTDMSRLLLPYLNRVEKDCPGMQLHLLHDYLVAISNENLSLPLKFFEGQEELSLRLLPDEVASLAVDCIYSYADTDQLHLAHSIMAGIPVQRIVSDTLIKQLDVLESELAACLILHRHNTPKSLGYIRDNKDDQQTILQLLIRLARTVANSYPPPSEAVWSSLLSDILDLQRSVFSCVPLHTCYEVFCSTLLASGDKASIKLTENYLINDNHQVSEPRLPKEKCIALVLSAAREYMDSAGTFTDTALDLAQLCLYLLPFEDVNIQEERNLLSAFQLLHEFGIKMLPIQVRLCPNRLLLIEECLKKKSGAHRNPSKLLQLAAYLNICGDDSHERQGSVLVLIAEAAYSMKDFSSCAETCNCVVAANYTDGWNITSKLARCEQFKDILTRTKLLNFALQHCPTEVLQELINVRRSLEMESLQQLVKNQIVMHNSGLSTKLEGQSTSYQPESLGIDFLQSLQIGDLSVQDTTQRLLTCVGDKQFWQKALRIGWDEGTDRVNIKKEGSSEHHTCHAFYASLYEMSSHCISKLGYQYDCFSAPDIPPQLLFEQALLRISMLEQESGTDQPNLPNVLSECALSMLSEDNSLGLGYVLSLPKSHAKEASHQVFEANTSIVSLQLAEYHSALLWYCDVVKNDTSKVRNVFFYNPHEVITLASQTNFGDKTWKNTIQYWKSQLADYVQAQDLLTLDCGVDVNRFASDDQYRHDSILGLAMSEDSERLRFALALASRHCVDRGEVIAEHISNLLLCDLPSDEVKERLLSSELQNTMKEAPETIKDKLESYVYPNIEGTQINQLELYYSVLNQVAPSNRSARLLPKDHLKLLSKVKSTTAAIDYKQLISGPKYTLKAVESSLTADNIPLIAKLLKAMPAALASPLSTSHLYAVFVKCQLLGSRNISFETLSPILGKMNGEDITQVVESTFFCDNSSEAFRLISSVDKFIETSLASCDFSECASSLKQLTSWKNHINNSKLLIEKWPDEEYTKQYFSTKGDIDALTAILKASFLNEEKPVAFILDLMEATSSAFGKAEEILIFDVMNDLVCSLKEEETDFSDLQNALQRLEQLAPFGKLNIGSGQWESLLCPLAAKESLPSNLRLKVFNIIQQTTTEPVQEPELLFSHTQAILNLSWPNISIVAEDLLDDEKRAQFLLNLIKVTESWQQRNALRDILDLWPSFETISESDIVSKVYCQLLVNCVLSEKGKWTNEKASYSIDICNRHPVSYSFLEQFFAEVQNELDAQTCEDTINEDDDSNDDVDIQLLILVCLLSKDSKAHIKAISLAQQKLMEPFHPEVAELALAHKLTVNLIATPAYSDLLSEVLETQPSSVESIVKSLVSKNHIPEAGSVILRSVSFVPRFMRTFSASLVAGLKQIDFESGLVSKLDHVPSRNKAQCSTSLTQPSENVAREEIYPSNNDWDADDNEWSDVEETEAAHNRENPDKGVNKVQEKSDQLQGESRSDQWNSPEGWDDWSEEEVEKITSRNENKKTNEEEDQLIGKKFTTPPLFPSPQSAFARVPPRESMSLHASPVTIPALGQTPPPSISKHVDDTDDVSDWGNNDDWDAEWET